MKQLRAPRPAPRTLSAPPPLPLRVPQTAHYEARFPALAVVLAGGVVLPACHGPVCGVTRADELEQHGAQGLREAGNGRASQALRELGVALGVVEHERTTVPEPQVAGAAPVVQTTPVVQPPPEPPPMVTGGAPPPVTLEPPPQPQGPNTTRPTPHPSTRRGAVRRVTPAPPPTPTMHVDGDQARVGPLPADRTRA